MTLFGIPYERKQLLTLLSDVYFALLAIYLAHLIRFGGAPDVLDPRGVLAYRTGASTLFVGTNLVVLYVLDTYNAAHDFRRPAWILRLWLGVFGALIAQMVLYYALPEWWWGRGVAALSSVLFAALLTLWRGVISWLHPATTPRLRTLVVGAGATGQAIVRVLRENAEVSQTYELVGYLDDDPETGDEATPRVGSSREIKDKVAEHQVGALIVAIRSGMGPEVTTQLLDCKAAGLRIEDSRTTYKRVTGKVPINQVSDTSLIFGPDFAGNSRWMCLLQRAADIAISLVGLTLSAPIIAVAGLAIKLETPGPAFFLQERVGLDEKPFTIVKLRTMGVDAEEGTGAVWSQGAGDPRVTRIGRFLRRTRIDELPQFWNVLRGDMSMVGPRPERAYFVRQLKEKIPFYGLRFVVKPGVTGWAQVMYRYGASEEDAAEKLRYDLFAVQELSPALYLLIILKTVQTVLLRPGS